MCCDVLHCDGQDTERVYTEVTQEIVSRYGKTYDWTLKSRMMGRNQKDAAQILVEALQIPLTPEEYLAERNAGHLARFPLCKPLPGVVRLITHLKKHSIPIIVATSSHADAFELKTRNNKDLFDLFDGHVVVGNDERVKNGKPAPDIFQVAARQIGNDLTNPQTCLVFEDSVPGVLAGLAAQMQVVWVPDPNLQADDSLHARCHVVTSLEHFDPSKFGLPAFD
ncbi:HAD-like domain-containing protein [Entophlyctis helioformis]|nr:HAD-like domain-containing protein [Entophlyctis helioformis]